MLNLTIASLVLSQMSRSPAFSGTGTRYHLSHLHYLHQISPLVFGYRSLLVEQSKFRYFTSSLIVSGADVACFNVDCTLSEADGTIYQCEVANACGAIPKYPNSAANPSTIINVAEGGPTSISVVECAFFSINYGLIILGTATQDVRIEGSCFSQMTPADGAVLLTSNLYDTSTLAVTIDTSSIYQCSSPKGVSSLKWGAELTLTMSLARDNFTYNTQTGTTDALMRLDAIMRQRSTTTMNQCWIMHTQTACLLEAEIATGGSSVTSTTLSNCFFYNTTISRTKKALFITAEQTWVIDGCAFDETSESSNILLSYPDNQLSRIQSIQVLNCFISGRYQDSFVPVTITAGKTVEASNNQRVNNNLINQVASFTMNEFLYKEYSDYCKIHTFPPTSQFTASNTWTPTPYIPTVTATPIVTDGPTASNPITVSVVFATVASACSGFVAFGAGALIFLCSRSCCVYDKENFLKVDV